MNFLTISRERGARGTSHQNIEEYRHFFISRVSIYSRERKWNSNQNENKMPLTMKCIPFPSPHPEMELRKTQPGRLVRKGNAWRIRRRFGSEGSAGTFRLDTSPLRLTNQPGRPSVTTWPLALKPRKIPRCQHARGVKKSRENAAFWRIWTGSVCLWSEENIFIFVFHFSFPIFTFIFRKS